MKKLEPVKLECDAKGCTNTRTVKAARIRGVLMFLCNFHKETLSFRTSIQ